MEAVDDADDRSRPDGITPKFKSFSGHRWLVQALWTSWFSVVLKAAACREHAIADSVSDCLPLQSPFPQASPFHSPTEKIPVARYQKDRRPPLCLLLFLRPSLPGRHYFFFSPRQTLGEPASFNLYSFGVVTTGLSVDKNIVVPFGAASLLMTASRCFA